MMRWMCRDSRAPLPRAAAFSQTDRRPGHSAGPPAGLPGHPGADHVPLRLLPVGLRGAGPEVHSPGWAAAAARPSPPYSTRGTHTTQTHTQAGAPTPTHTKQTHMTQHTTDTQEQRVALLGAGERGGYVLGVCCDCYALGVCWVAVLWVWCASAAHARSA